MKFPSTNVGSSVVSNMLTKFYEYDGNEKERTLHCVSQSKDSSFKRSFMSHILSTLFTLHLHLSLSHTPSLSCSVSLIYEKKIYMRKINTLSHQPSNMVDLSVLTKLRHCATFQCVWHTHTHKHWKRRKFMFLAWLIQIMFDQHVCHVQSWCDGISSQTRHWNNNFL